MEIRENLQKVEQRIAEACKRAGRRREDITLIAVSKTHPAEDVLEALACGQIVFGENRVQELREKTDRIQERNRRTEVPGTRNDIPGVGYAQSRQDGLRWHLIGTLQTNKVKYLPGIRNLEMIHSVDSLKLAQEIERRYAGMENLREMSLEHQATAGITREEAHRMSVMDVLIEVNMAGEDTKQGIAPQEAEVLLREIAPLEHLRVKGLMTIAPFTDDAETNRVHFAGLRKLLESLNEKSILPYPLTELSMGMSGDYEVAIEEGATLVRVGTAIFGARDYGSKTG